MVVLNAALHVLQFIQHGKHVDELAQREQVRLRHKVLPPLSVTQAFHLTAKALYGFPLQGFCTDLMNGPFPQRTFSSHWGQIYLEVHEFHELGHFRL